ncbi:hypothetical protein D1872_261330 [compost metagenome]
MCLLLFHVFHNIVERGERDMIDPKFDALVRQNGAGVDQIGDFGAFEVGQAVPDQNAVILVGCIGANDGRFAHAATIFAWRLAGMRPFDPDVIA